MNPNLSPMSNSGITLEMGQVVYFFPNGKKGKKEVLFVVTEDFQNGQVLEIDELIAEKKKQVNKWNKSYIWEDITLNNAA